LCQRLSQDLLGPIYSLALINDVANAPKIAVVGSDDGSVTMYVESRVTASHFHPAVDMLINDVYRRPIFNILTEPTIIHNPSAI
jgi:hypothetical protein